MLELLQLYYWTLPVGICFAMLLALLGIQLSARDRCLQSFCVSQASLFGVLLGLGLHQPPLVLSIIVASGVFVLSQKIALGSSSNRNTRLGAVFIILLTGAHLLSVVFPSLESHLSSIFFGDLATLSVAQAKLLLPIGLGLLGVLLFFWRPLSNQSLEIALFGEHTVSVLLGKSYVWVLSILSLVVLVVSVQFLGFLFTVAFLYLPTVILGASTLKGQIKHAIACAGSAGVSVIVGLLLSLAFPEFPTVPTLILVYCLLTFPMLLFKKF